MRQNAACVSGLLAAAIILGGAAPSTTPANRQTLAQYVHTQVTAALDEAQSTGKFVFATTKLRKLVEQVALVTSDKNREALREAVFGHRLLKLVGELRENNAVDTLRFLRANDNLAHALVFVMRQEDQPEDVAAVLNHLRQKHGGRLDAYANLAAAICVVHDETLSRHINENVTRAPDAADIFDYFASNEKSMLFGIKNVPPELLVYVVDTTSPIEQMRWALRKYTGDADIGRHFFDVPYDWEYFKSGKDKKVNKQGYTLPNILKFGGVCADQAFFAVEIGKAIGVPTAYTTGESGEVGHAWVGFLQAKEGKGAWNFDTGRYEEYKGVRGTVRDPQTGRGVPDAYVSLLAEMIETKPVDRQISSALTDGADAIFDAALSGTDIAELPGGLGDVARPRNISVDSGLEILESAVNLNPGNPRPWYLLAGLAKEGKLNAVQKSRWSDTLLRLTGTKYPDFAVAVLGPLIDTVEEPAEQNRLWNAAFAKFQGRADLAATIRMKQAKLWEKQRDTAKAGQCYMDVIERYANAGPFVLDALDGAEKLLGNNTEKVLLLYDQTWAKIQKPSDLSGPFMDQSNWYRVGAEYSDKLRAAGKTELAANVSAQLKASLTAGK